MNKNQIEKVWTLSLTVVVLQICYALWQTSELGFDGVVNFIQPVLVLSITAGLIKFQKRGWLFSWVGLFLLGYLVNVYSKETAVGMIGSFIFLLLAGAPICYFLIQWTKPIWQGENKMSKARN